MGRTCGEPNETELTPIWVKMNGPQPAGSPCPGPLARTRTRLHPNSRRRWVCVSNKSVNIFRVPVGLFHN